MPKGFLPNPDTGLLAWSKNFSSAIHSDPESFGLTAPMAANFASLLADFEPKLLACEPTIRSKSAVAQKNESREKLKTNARTLAHLVYATPGVTDAQKLSLGLNVRSKPSPIPPPDRSPVIHIRSVSGCTVKIQLQDGANASHRGKPAGAQGASVFSFAGDLAPTDLSNWKFEGNFGKTRINLNFPSALPPGTTVWLTAFWFNPRAQAGPVCPPVSTNLQGGAVANSGSLALAA